MTANIEDYLLRKTAVSGFAPVRLMTVMRNQTARTPLCPEEPRLNHRIALVTGGNSGIGFETCRGLLQRGAQVILASRDRSRTDAACEQLRKELGGETEVEPLVLDLSDLESVAQAARSLVQRLQGRKLDILIANAGIWPRKHALSAQGHEIAFATNVLGHHLLIRRLLSGQHLVESARLVILTGDIYILTKQCTADYTYRTQFGGMLAYCRSKLGNLWVGAQLHSRFPELQVFMVHPGVVASRLGVNDRTSAHPYAGGPQMSCELGAQTPLVCATQPNLETGGYYHNTFGLVQFKPKDPALDAAKAQALWETAEKLCENWLVD